MSGLYSRYIFVTILVCGWWVHVRTEYAHQNCDKDPSMCNAAPGAFCHKISKMCVCMNGASTYPMCDMNNGRPCYDCLEKEDFCKSSPKCCNKICDHFEMCYDGECECMYGKDRRGRCIRCMEPCKRNQVCRRNRRNGKYSCKAKLPAIDCSDICGVGSKCKRVRGVVHCTACGPGKRLDDGICATAYTWSPWSLWSGCSITCGKGGKRTRRRRCNVPEKCPGETREQTDCVEKLKICYGKWSAWGPYITACSSNCGGGVQNRYRTCQGGEYCPGLPFSQRKCNTMPCGGGGD